MKKVIIMILSAVILIFSGCWSSSKDKEREEGSIDGRCYENGTCNEGLTCDTENNICIRDNGQQTNDSDNPETTSDNDINPTADDVDSADDSDDSTPEEDVADTELVIKSTSYGNICTGQTICADYENELNKCPAEGSAFYGQDAQYAAKGLCVPQKFSIDSTVKNEKIVIDENTGMQWQQTIPEEEVSLEEAEQYCDELVYGGYDDWRMPNVIEIESLFRDMGQYIEINRDYFPNPNPESSQIWTDRFLVDLIGGESFQIYASDDNKALIRCIRRNILSTVSYLATAKAANNDMIVKDTASDLIWQYGTASNKTWKEALDYCENLEYAGHSDWRLPNRNELLSLEYSGQNYIFPVSRETFWSSTTTPAYYGSSPRYMAFSVNFETDELYHEMKTIKNHVRCVRYPTTPAPDEKPVAKRAVTIGNICTGIKKCYKTPTVEDFYAEVEFFSSEIPCDDEDAEGQDAQQAEKGVCLPKSFSIDDTAVENEKIVSDSNTGLQWQQTVSEEKYNFEKAAEYCKKLSYGGHDDWRLPTVQELASIIDDSGVITSIDSDYFPNTPVSDGNDFSYFWTSSSYAGEENYVWIISFDLWFTTYHESINKEHFVRCVRGEQMSVNSFKTLVQKGDLIVKDTTSGLVWAADYIGTFYWSGALSYCNNLDYAGYTDWRLPNRNELLSLVNYDKIMQASDFPEIAIKEFWTSSPLSTYDKDKAYLGAFTVEFNFGKTQARDVNSPLIFAICVR